MPSKKKSNLSAKTRAAKRVKQYRAQLKKALSQLPRPEDCIPLSEEALQREREMNEVIFAEIMAKNEKHLSGRLVSQPKAKLRTQPPHNNRQLQVCLPCGNIKGGTSWHQDYNKFVEPQPLLKPIRSRPTNILVQEAKRSLRAELVVKRKMNAALRAEQKGGVKRSLPGDTQSPENELKDGLVQKQCMMVSIKSEPIL